jgi:hypothetical protein
VYKRVFQGLAILAAVVFAGAAPAKEPDGRVAFRYDWLDKLDGDTASPKLRLTITAFVDLKEAELRATLPAGIGLTLKAAGRAPAPWPEDGIALGDVAAGQTIVVELDIAKPAQGGGIVSFAIQGTSDGRPVREGVGVPVGVAGTAPTLRNGAAEFPAARPDSAP